MLPALRNSGTTCSPMMHRSKERSFLPPPPSPLRTCIQVFANNSFLAPLQLSAIFYLGFKGRCLSLFGISEIFYVGNYWFGWTWEGQGRGGEGKGGGKTKGEGKELPVPWKKRNYDYNYDYNFNILINTVPGRRQQHKKIVGAGCRHE